MIDSPRFADPFGMRFLGVFQCRGIAHHFGETDLIFDGQRDRGSDRLDACLGMAFFLFGICHLVFRSGILVDLGDAQISTLLAECHASAFRR